MWRSRWRCVIKPAYSVSFLLSIHIFVWQNVLYFPNDPHIYNISVAVTIECHRGQLFSVYAFNKFATSLADACLRKGDLAAFCSACVCESSKYRIEKGCHHLEAHIGIPEQPSAKIFFARTHITVSLLLYFCLYALESIFASCAMVGFHDMNGEMWID